MWSSDCISLYLNREWDAIMLRIVNHFRLVQFKAKLWCSHFTGNTTCLFRPTSPFQPYHSRNKVHQLDPARNPPAHHCSSLCSSIAGYSQILLSPKALNSHSPLQQWVAWTPCPPTALELPFLTVRPRCGNYNVGGHGFLHQRADLNHLRLACESIYFNIVKLVHSLDST